MKVLLASILLFSVLASNVHSLRSLKRHGVLEPPLNARGPKAPEEYFTQRLDHFDATETRTWQQRYYSNMENYVEGGPAFMMIGGEGAASDRWMTYGQWYGWAKEHGAAMFNLEHRYYGQSRPTEDLSVANLKWHSSRQALADLAEFMTAMNQQYNFTGPWITFGGSYPGSLSAWARLKYPHLVKGSVSSSGPLFAKLDFWEYFGVVESAMDITGPSCNENLRAAIASAEQLLIDDAPLLSEMFKTCNPIDPTNEMDAKSFLEYIIDNLAGVVQYNGYTPIWTDVHDVCAIMNDEATGSPLERFAKLNDVLLAENGASCMAHEYQEFLNELQDENWTDFGIWRQWSWQTCTEFGWYQTTNQPSGVYGNTLDLPFFEQWCMDAYGDAYNHERLQSLMDETNAQYGGYTPDVDNVVFVHGSVDPWHAMGVLEDLSPMATAIYINGTSHCADMYEEDVFQGELDRLREARTEIGALVAQWVQK